MIITASIEICNSIANHLTGPTSKWFGFGTSNQSFSLDGNRVVAIEQIGQERVVSIEQMADSNWVKHNPYWQNRPQYGTTRYSVVLGFASHSEAESAFKTPTWELQSGVLLCLSGMISSIPSDFLNIQRDRDIATQEWLALNKVGPAVPPLSLTQYHNSSMEHDKKELQEMISAPEETRKAWVLHSNCCCGGMHRKSNVVRY